MTNKDFFAALEDLEREKGISKDVFINYEFRSLFFFCLDVTMIEVNNFFISTQS